jgi:pyrimidine 5'-nucleotidase
MTITQRPQITAILCDLDDCVYENTAMQHQVAENIRHYMVERLGMPADEVAEKCADLYLNYGTTLAGLVASGHKIDYDDWHAAVHGSLDYEQYLEPDPALRALLHSIPVRKDIFTNADRRHAERCLDLLGIRDCFASILCFEDIMAAAEARGLVHHGCPVVCKPNRQAFDIAMQLVGIRDPSATLWLDDSARNITTGHRMGLYSVLVGRTGVACPSDQQIRHIHDLPTALPWLWAGQQPPVALEEAAAAVPKEAAAAAEVEVAAASSDATAALKAAAAAKGGGRASTEDSDQIEAVFAAA